MRGLFLGVVMASAVLAACGDPTSPVRTPSARQALTLDAAAIEFESLGARQEMFRELVRASQVQAERDGTDPVLFPTLRDGRLVAAKPLEGRADLLQAPDAGAALALRFSGHDPWPEDRREALQGLSEREAAELVARTLLAQWGVATDAEILVDRAEGAPYAVAYVDGVLRVNPVFLYMAAAIGPSSVQTPLQ
jgi:hypothetical protein